MTRTPPRRSLARLALFLASFALAVLLGTLGEAGRRGLWPLAIVGVIGACWVIYLATLWLIGRTFRGSASPGGMDPKSEDRVDLFAEASLLLGPEEATRLTEALSPAQMRQFLERRRHSSGTNRSGE